MNNEPLISIIIPTCNRAHLIGETIESVLAQTYDNWECIIVDDGSSDNTDEVVGAYVAKDSRFKYYHRPDTHKPGGNGARNYGFKMSKGEYINWFDSDDVMYEDCLMKKAEPFLKNTSLDVVFSAYNYFNKNGTQNRISNNFFSGNILDDKLNNLVNFSTHSFMLRKDALINYTYDETIRKSQDLDFFFRLFSTNPDLKIKNVNTPLYKVRKHNKQISTKVSGNGLELKSKYWVHHRIIQYYKALDNKKGVAVNKKITHHQLKFLLENKNYLFVIKRLIKSDYYSFQEKIFLLYFSLIFILSGKGLNRFKNRI